MVEGGNTIVKMGDIINKVWNFVICEFRYKTRIAQFPVSLSVGPVFEFHSLLILGWWSSLPRALDIWTLHSVPIFKFLCFPSCDGSGPPLSSPPIFSRVLSPPGHLSRLLSQFFLFASSLSICLFLAPPFSSVWSFIVRPSEVFRPPADRRPMSSPGFLSSGPYAGLHPPPTCAAVGTWLGCGRRGGGDGAPRDGLESLDASTGNAWFSVPSSTLKFSLWFLMCLFLCIPLTPYNRTCPYTLPPNRRVFLWSLCAPLPAGPGRPGVCLNVSGPRPCPPPTLPIPWTSLLGRIVP